MGQLVTPKPMAWFIWSSVRSSSFAAGTTAASGVVQQEGVREEVQTGVPADVPTEPALPALTSDRAYVTMLTKDGSGYEVFRAEDLIAADGKNLISENRKVELMEEQGIYRNAIDLDAMKVSAEQTRVGLILVGSAATCMMVLLAILYEKKRRMNRM